MNNFFQFIFKPVLSCNLQCSYCYAEKLKSAKTKIITKENAFNTFEWIARFAYINGLKKINILWHGGEPFLFGAQNISNSIEYYQKLFDSYGIEYSSSIQTNLTLLNDDFIWIIKEYFDSECGFSYDYNSNSRLLKNGKNAESLILEKANLALKNDIQLGAICQITKSNLKDAAKMYSHFNETGISFKTSRIFYTENDNPLSHDNEFVNDQEYASFCCNIFDIWINDIDPKISIVNLEEYISAILAGKTYSCCFSKDCSSNSMTFIPNGDIFPCPRYNTSSNKIGNIYKTLPYIHTTSTSEKQTAPRKCKNCRYWRICFGGCRFNQSTGWSQHECRSNIIIWKHIEKTLRNMGYDLFLDEL